MPATPDEETTAKPRATRITYRGIARREQILATATKMFLEQGYAGVSVDEIMKTVGGSKTNLYSQFGGKEQLFVAVVEAICADLLRDFKEMDISGKQPTEGLRILADSLLDVLMRDEHLAFQRLIIAESGRFPALGQVWLESGPEQTRQVIARFIEEQQREGRFRQADAKRAAILFHDMITFNPIHLAMLGARPTAEEIGFFVDDAIAAFLHGYAVQPAEPAPPPLQA